MNFEYIVSGITYSGGDIYYSDNPKIKAFISELFKNINSSVKYQTFSVLYNAYTESKLGAPLNELSGYKHIKADSGGLQLAILANKKTPQEVEKAKIEVYKNQAEYSDIGMCFDEIPIYIPEDGFGKNNRISVGSKYFVEDLIIPKAQKTADNIKKQIEIFQSMNTKTRVMIIAQGQDLNSYRKYTETIIDLLTEDELEYIYGIAPSSACNGTGALERMDMLYTLKDLQIPDKLKKKIHLLGVGSYSGLFPLVINPDYFSFIKNLSYDSTSHSSKFVFGTYINEHGKTIALGKHLTPTNEKIIRSLYEKYKHYFDKFEIKDFDYFIHNCTVFSEANEKGIIQYANDKSDHYKLISKMFSAAFMMEIIKNFMIKLDKIIETPNIFKGRTADLIRSTDFIRTYDEYLQWKKTYGKQMKSAKIPKINKIDDIINVNNKSLDNFF